MVVKPPTSPFLVSSSGQFNTPWLPPKWCQLDTKQRNARVSSRTAPGLIEDKKGEWGEGAPSDVHRAWQLGRAPGSSTSTEVHHHQWFTITKPLLGGRHCQPVKKIVCDEKSTSKVLFCNFGFYSCFWQGLLVEAGTHPPGVGVPPIPGGTKNRGQTSFQNFLCGRTQKGRRIPQPVGGAAPHYLYPPFYP